jgi:hypothetical protein
VPKIEVTRQEPLDEEIAEDWTRQTNEPTLRGVGSSRWAEDEAWPWVVSVSVMEFVRTEPLESEIASAIMSALASVPNVLEVHRDDRETWVIAGKPDGAALVRAVAVVVDTFAPRTQASFRTRPWWRFW